MIGQFGGFRLAVRMDHRSGDYGRVLVLVGNNEYEANYTDNQDGLVRVVEYALNRIDQQLELARERLIDTEKRLAALKVEVAKRFDKIDRLDWLHQRQLEIESALDLSKGDTAVGDVPKVA